MSVPVLVTFRNARASVADGGVIRDRAGTEAAIDEAVSRYIAARRNSES